MLSSLFKYYLELYITDTTLKVSRSLYCFATSVSHGVKTISPGLISDELKAGCFTLQVHTDTVNSNSILILDFYSA